MSWRVVSTVMIAIFVIVLVSATTANPIHEVTNTLADMDDSGGQYDAEEKADSALRAYSNLILILVFGTIAWGGWYYLRRELTEGQL